MYIAASFDFPTRLVLTLEKLFDLGLNAPAVFVEKGEQLGKLEVGQVTVFICPTLRALSATSATAKVPYWSSIEAEYERALSMVRRHHERKMAAAGLHA
jgi:hypothetical protein